MISNASRWHFEIRECSDMQILKSAFGSDSYFESNGTM